MSRVKLASILVAILCAAALVVFFLGTGIDQRTTYGSTFLGRAIVWSSSIGIGTLALYSWFTRKDWEQSGQLVRLRSDRPFVWAGVGLFCSALLSLSVASLVNTCVGAAAQYLPGELSELPGVVAEVKDMSPGRGVCQIRITIVIQDGAKSVRPCLKSRYRAAIGPMSLQKGDGLSLISKSTPLGPVAVAIRRVRESA